MLLIRTAKDQRAAEDGSGPLGMRGGMKKKNINNKFGRNNEILRKKLIKRKHRYYANRRWKRTRPFSDVTSSGLNRD